MLSGHLSVVFEEMCIQVFCTSDVSESSVRLHSVVRPVLSTLCQMPPFSGWDLPREMDEKPGSAQLSGHIREIGIDQQTLYQLQLLRCRES